MPLGLMWIDDDNQRFVFDVPRHLWGEDRAIIDYWISYFGLPNGFRTLPKWVFYLADNRLRAYVPADQNGLDIVELRRRITVILEKSLQFGHSSEAVEIT